MQKEFVPLGERPINEIISKLNEIGEVEVVSKLNAYTKSPLASKSGRSIKPWLNTQHQYGFIPLYEPGSSRFHQIVSASNMQADESLRNQRINIKLGYLRVYEYPKPFIYFGKNKHIIYFTFEARNQIPNGGEPVAFNQTYEATSGQDAAVTGYPIFIGLNVGLNGVEFSCKTVNVGNTNDKELVNAIYSDAMTSGLNLLTTAQPVLAPFVGIARGLCVSLAERSKNVPVQKFALGLDFETGATGARLATGSYVVAQVERANEINWSDWKFDAETGTIVRTTLVDGVEPYPLPYNAIVFRVSKYLE
jgi:hypothetical protein